MSVKHKSQDFILSMVQEVKTLPPKDLKEILDFVYFVKARAVTEPSQAYFWTKMWQRMESSVDEDKKSGKIIGNGKIANLLKELKRREH